MNPCLPKFGENLAIIWPTPPFKLFHSPAFAPPAELKQASNMLGWEIPPLEENPTHTYGSVTSESCSPCQGPCSLEVTSRSLLELEVADGERDLTSHRRFDL